MQRGDASLALRIRPPLRRQAGFTYLTVVAGVAVLGVGLAAIAPMWAEASRREREQELLRVGQLYAKAIRTYHEQSPGSVRRYPPDLESLLLDPRPVGTRRHLRRLYADPLKPARPWGLVRNADGGIEGVFSQDGRRPLLQAHMRLETVDLRPAASYAEWVFGWNEARQ